MKNNIAKGVVARQENSNLIVGLWDGTEISCIIEAKLDLRRLSNSGLGKRAPIGAHVLVDLSSNTVIRFLYDETKVAISNLLKKIRRKY